MSAGENFKKNIFAAYFAFFQEGFQKTAFPGLIVATIHQIIQLGN